MNRQPINHILSKLISTAAALALLLPMVLLTGCDHKELCYHHIHVATVRVAFDWRDAPDANPAGMSVFFYPIENRSSKQRYEFKGTQGGQVDVPVGRYIVLAYNNDTELIEFGSTNTYGNHLAACRPGTILSPTGSRGDAPRSEGAEDEDVALTVDPLWGCTATEVEVTESGISYICIPESLKDEWIGKPVYSTEHVITLYPHQMTSHYTFEIRNVENLQRVVKMSAAITGMAPSMSLADESVDTRTVTHPLEAKRLDDRTIGGEFHSFGYHPESARPHKMTLYVWTDDGHQYVFGSDGSLDVTDQVRNAKDTKNVLLIIDGLTVPDPFTPDVFDPAFDDWISVEYDVPV